ncbi:hypothetical protein D1007_41354 [Hordeum vulgare]|nr:hypothetical protein D1007_41354 [Hordeum vulgare]
MDQSIAWQKSVQDLAGNNQEIRDARGREAPCLPPGYCVPPSSVILWAMREVQRTTDPTQRARWWMYRSSRMTAPQPDPTRLASRTERVTDAVLALSAAVLNPEVQIIAPVFTGGNKKKKPVVRRSEHLKNLKNN